MAQTLLGMSQIRAGCRADLFTGSAGIASGVPVLGLSPATERRYVIQSLVRRSERYAEYHAASLWLKRMAQRMTLAVVVTTAAIPNSDLAAGS